MELSVTIKKGLKSRLKTVTEEVFQSDVADDESLMLKVLRRHKSRDTTGWSVVSKKKIVRESDGTFIRFEDLRI